MNTMKLNFLTSNQFKVETAKLAFAQFEIEVLPLSLEIPEIQADTNAEIAKYSAQLAAKQLNEPVMREDHGFYLNAFPGFPGPYMAHTERIIPPEDALKLLSDKDRTGYFEMALAYATPEGELVEYSYQLPCTISKDIRLGGKDFGWDSIICLKDEDRALSEYPPQDRYKFFTQNYTYLANYLQRNT